MDREVLVSKYVKRVQRMCLEGRKTAQERAVVETLLELQGKPAPEWPEARVRPPKARKRQPGAKKGHPGSRREVPERIDRRVKHRAKRCPDCGRRWIDGSASC